jgi:hypothetical protein
MHAREEAGRDRLLPGLCEVRGITVKPHFLVYDTLDDRREVLYLLGRLAPARRVAYLRWCCARAVVPGSATHPGPSRKTLALAERARTDSSADERLTLDLYLDWWTLCTQYELDADAALAELLGRARQKG